MLHEETTKEIIGAAFGVACVLEAPIKVRFKGKIAGDYFADILVAERVLVESKVAKQYKQADEAQLLNELKATAVKVGLLIDFGGEKVEFKRLVM